MTLNRLAGRQAVCFQALEIVQHKKGCVDDLRKLRNKEKRNEAILSFLYSGSTKETGSRIREKVMIKCLEELRKIDLFDNCVKM